MSPKPLKNVESRETKGQIVNYKNSQGVCVCVGIMFSILALKIGSEGDKISRKNCLG